MNATRQDEYILFVRDPRTRKYTTDGAAYASEADALTALGDRIGYATLRRTWTREFAALGNGRNERR